MFASPGLDAGFFIRTQHVITRSQGLILPTALIEAQDATGLDGESRVARENPVTMPPWSQCILAEPAPERRAADLRDHTVLHGLAAQLGERPVRQRQSTTHGQFTGQGLDLDHDTGGKARRSPPARLFFEPSQALNVETPTPLAHDSA